MKKLQPNYFRNILFGAEDALVSTVGVLFGVASAEYDKGLIITTGLVVIAVEALSMGAGSYLTETSTHEIDTQHVHKDNPIIDGILMFISYFLFGFVPLLPYIIIEQSSAKTISLIITLLALFIVGYAPNRSFKGALRMAVIASLAVLIGFVIGTFANTSL